MEEGDNPVNPLATKEDIAKAQGSIAEWIVLIGFIQTLCIVAALWMLLK